LEDGVGLVLVLRVLAHHPIEVACEAGDHHEGRAGIDECVAEGSRVLPGAGDAEREDQGRDAADAADLDRGLVRHGARELAACGLLLRCGRWRHAPSLPARAESRPIRCQRSQPPPRRRDALAEVDASRLDGAGERPTTGRTGGIRLACTIDRVDYRLRTGKNECVSTPSRHASGEASRPFRIGQAAQPGREDCAQPAAGQPAARPHADLPRAHAPNRAASARTLLRSLATLLLITVMTFSVAACGPDRGLKVSPEGNPSPSLFAPDSADAGPPNEPFSLKEIRRTIEDTSGVAVT